MGSHETHNMHDNSMEAWYAFDMSKRERQVCEVYQRMGWMSDRDVCYSLGSADMNYARPAITALILAGTLIEHPDKWPCDTTHRHVRKCNFAPNPVYIKPVDCESESMQATIDRLTAELDSAVADRCKVILDMGELSIQTKRLTIENMDKGRWIAHLEPTLEHCQKDLVSLAADNLQLREENQYLNDQVNELQAELDETKG